MSLINCWCLRPWQNQQRERKYFASFYLSPMLRNCVIIQFYNLHITTIVFVKYLSFTITELNYQRHLWPNGHIYRTKYSSMGIKWNRKKYHEPFEQFQNIMKKLKKPEKCKTRTLFLISHSPRLISHSPSLISHSPSLIHVIQ